MFSLKKKKKKNPANRIMLRLGLRSSSRVGFTKLDILTVPCLYIYALMSFAVKNLNIYQPNTSVHCMNANQRNELHITSVRLSSIQIWYLVFILSMHHPHAIGLVIHNPYRRITPLF